jgi:hypothetical protein
MKLNFLQALLLFYFLFITEFSFGQNPLMKQWDKRFGGSDDDYITGIQATSDGKYILSGYSYSGTGGNKTEPSQGGGDYWIVKIDAVGGFQWDKRFGGTWSDYHTSLKQTHDGGYILGGYSPSGIGGDKTQPSWGFDDYWIVKTDSLGNFQWDKRFGGTDDDALFSLQQTADGGYILGGYSYSGISGNKTQPSWGTCDYWIVKTDSLGNFQWDKRFGGTDDDLLFSLDQTTDGGFILGGYSVSGNNGDKTQPSWGGRDYWIVKTDSLGNFQWDKRFGGTDDDYFSSLNKTMDGGFILGGYSVSGNNGDITQPSWGGRDYWIVKTDSSGNFQWDGRYGGSDSDDDVGNIVQTFDSGYLIAGTSYSGITGDKTENSLGIEQTWVVKTDSFGIKQWDKTIFTEEHDEAGYAIQTNDGCYLIGNYTAAGIGGYKTQGSWNGSNDYWIVKFCDTTLQPLFSAGNSFLCKKFCTNFFDQSYNNPIAWQWVFPGGDPSSSTNQNPVNICYNNSGTFDVTLITTNAYGNDTLTLTNYITVYPTPAFPVITQTGYTLTSSLANSYQWQFNSVDIPGATNQSYDAQQSGYYTVFITDQNGCVSSTTTYILIDGIEDVNSGADVLIYPNPSNGDFNVELLNCQIADELKIEIRNTIGQIIFSSEDRISSADWVTEIDLRSSDTIDRIPAGVFFIEISVENSSDKRHAVIARRKIIIAK